MKWIKKFESTSDKRDVNYVVSKILQHFKKEEVLKKISESEDMDEETILIDMICWYEDEFSEDIPDEDVVIERLKKEYGL
jgi:ribosomal protein S24E